MSVTPRLILLHKHKTSGRVRFLCFSTGIIAFGRLPALSALRDEDYSPTVHFHPTAIIRDLDLIRPIYSQVTNYGHFGRELDVMTWERTDRAEALAAAVRG